MSALGFQAPIAPSGYRWWYVDALSDDGRYGLVTIFFAANPFSPLYLSRLRDGLSCVPEDYAAVNVVLYRGRRKLWTMTGFDRSKLLRASDGISVGPNQLQWDGRTLTLSFACRSPLIRSALRGSLTLRARAVHQAAHQLVGGVTPHHWRPIAPLSDVEIILSEPALRFSGRGYFDSNWGASPLVDAFRRWHWQRSLVGDGAAIVYGGMARDGSPFAVQRLLRVDGSDSPLVGLRAQPVGRTRWLLRRELYTAQTARVVRTLESAPFYARTQAEIEVEGQRVETVSETMDLDRLRRRWIQAAFYLRMRRAGLGRSADHDRLLLTAGRD